MDDIVTRPAEEISREELYELVWQTREKPLGRQNPRTTSRPKHLTRLSIT